MTNSNHNDHVKAFFSLMLSTPAYGMPNPNMQMDYNVLPGKDITWDGVPMNDFDAFFLKALRTGLGQISMDGHTLLSCVLGSDGWNPVTANPHYAIASPQQRNQYLERSKRAFACINHISHTSDRYQK